MLISRGILLKWISTSIILLLLTSCYSVRIKSTRGTPKETYNEREDYYRDLDVIELDTIITIGATTKDFTLLLSGNKCDSGILHTLEYRNTLGGLLLSAITLGRKRKVNIKYVCLKPSN